MDVAGPQFLLPFPDDGPPSLDDVNQLWRELGQQLKEKIFSTPMINGEKEKRRVWNLTRRGFGAIRNVVCFQEQMRKRAQRLSR